MTKQEWINKMLEHEFAPDIIYPVADAVESTAKTKKYPIERVFEDLWKLYNEERQSFYKWLSNAMSVIDNAFVVIVEDEIEEEFPEREEYEYFEQEDKAASNEEG